MADRPLLAHLSLFTLLSLHRLGHQAEVQLKRELERQRKALINEHKRQQKQAADNLRQVRKVGAQSPIGTLGRLLMCISSHLLPFCLFFRNRTLTRSTRRMSARSKQRSATAKTASLKCASSGYVVERHCVNLCSFSRPPAS